MDNAIYTIGHSTHSVEKLIELLNGQGVNAVCDVRSRPYSRMNPQFNREPLKEELRAVGIKYVFLGKELGARSDDKSCYRNGKVRYDLLAKTDLFKQGIERVKEGARSYRVALMCAEKEPLECHRTILISRKLIEDGVAVLHILGDGQIEEHARTIDRLVSKLRMPEIDMFRAREAIISEAYSRQGNDIAYQEQAADTSASDQVPPSSARGAAE